MVRTLSAEQRQLVEDWVNDKFVPVDREDLDVKVDPEEWERIDPWLADEIEANGDFERYPEDGEMQVRVIVESLALMMGFDEPLVERWTYADLRRVGADPLDDADVAACAADMWSPLFEGFTETWALSEVAWVPRANSNASEDNVGAFARIAGDCGFYVFDIDNQVVLTMDHDVADPILDIWSTLFEALTGRKLSQPPASREDAWGSYESRF